MLPVPCSGASEERGPGIDRGGGEPKIWGDMAVPGPEAMCGGASESQVGALALDESVLLEALRAGEEGSFRALIEAYLAERQG